MAHRQHQWGTEAASDPGLRVRAFLHVQLRFSGHAEVTKPSRDATPCAPWAWHKTMHKTMNQCALVWSSKSETRWAVSVFAFANSMGRVPHTDRVFQTHVLCIHKAHARVGRGSLADPCNNTHAPRTHSKATVRIAYTRASLALVSATSTASNPPGGCVEGEEKLRFG